MIELHPENEYTFDTSIIRDMADVCVTLNNILGGKFRKKFGKLHEAASFFIFLRNELEDGLSEQ